MPNNELCYDVGAIRKLLTNSLDDPGLDALCQDYFYEVYNRFGRGMRKDEKINDLIDYCQRNPERRFEKLLGIIRREHKDLFRQYQPYLKPCDDDSPTLRESSKETREETRDIEASYQKNIVNQVTSGDGNIPIQIVGSNVGNIRVGRRPTPTETDHPILLSRLAKVKTQIEAEASPEKKDAAIEQVEELAEAITAPKPDLDTIGYAKGWFAKNIPALAEAINSIITDPTTSELITAADEGLGAEFKRRFG